MVGVHIQTTIHSNFQENNYTNHWVLSLSQSQDQQKDSVVTSARTQETKQTKRSTVSSFKLQQENKRKTKARKEEEIERTTTET
jgi:hypothetical protein